MTIIASIGVVIALCILVASIKPKKKKRRVIEHKVKYDEVGDNAGIEDFYNVDPIDVIMLEGCYFLQDKIDCNI